MTTPGALTARRAGRERLRVAATVLGASLRRLVTPLAHPPATTGFRALLRAHAVHAGLVLAAVVIAMVALDPRAGAVRSLPHWIIDVFEDLTDFGRSGWVLIPTAIALVLVTALMTPAVDRWSRGVLAAVTVRLGFVFVAVGAPSLAGTIVKRLIGRARPSGLGPYAYDPFIWRSEYASLPSGHTISAFATLVTLGALWPAARAWLWGFAILIGVSRVIVTAHFPSDVVAGAAFGAFGAMLVREWFASRRLVFGPTPDGHLRARPAPSLGRIARAVHFALSK